MTLGVCLRSRNAAWLTVPHAPLCLTSRRPHVPFESCTDAAAMRRAGGSKARAEGRFRRQQACPAARISGRAQLTQCRLCDVGEPSGHHCRGRQHVLQEQRGRSIWPPFGCWAGSGCAKKVHCIAWQQASTHVVHEASAVSVVWQHFYLGEPGIAPPAAREACACTAIQGCAACSAPPTAAADRSQTAAVRSSTEPHSGPQLFLTWVEERQGHVVSKRCSWRCELVAEGGSIAGTADTACTLAHNVWTRPRPRPASQSSTACQAAGLC